MKIEEDASKLEVTITKPVRQPRCPTHCWVWILIFISSAPPVNAQGSSPGTGRDGRLWREALRIHRSAIVVDGHNDITTAMVDDDYDLEVPSHGKHHTDLARMKKGGLSAQFFSVYVSQKFATNGGAARRALEMIDGVNRAVERNRKDLSLATSVSEIRRAKRQGKIAALLGIEGGAAIENSLAALRGFYRLGARYMTLTHMHPTDWADSSTAPARHNGLTEFGKAVVAEMNRLGMMVDVSHVSDKTMSDVLDISTAPVIASHSSARELSFHPRNIPDDLLRRVATNGGVVMVNFFTAYIDPRVRQRYDQLQSQVDALRIKFKDDRERLREERKKLFASKLPPTPLTVLIEHIEHIAKVAGFDHVGLGSDFDGISSLPEGIQDVSQFPNITYELLVRGHCEKDIRKILGENLLRAFSEVEQVARAKGQTISGDGTRLRFDESMRD